MNDNIDQWLNKTFGKIDEAVQKKRGGGPAHEHRHQHKHDNVNTRPHGERHLDDSQKKINNKQSNMMNNVKKNDRRERPLFKNQQVKKGVFRIIPMGGLNEVGQNMMIFEYENDIVLVDMGFMFPDDDMLGIDYVVPDTTYLEERKKNIRAVII